MAEASISIEATNLAGLGSSFYTQSSSTSVETTNTNFMNETGDMCYDYNLVDVTNCTQTAKYCGTDLVTDLGTFLTQFGDVQNGYCVTGLTIEMTAADKCSISLEMHQHDSNPHVSAISLGYADVSDFLPHEIDETFEAWDGYGIPSFDLTVGTDASPQSATVTFSINHVDKIAEDGTHLFGKSITPRCELSMDFSGIPTSQTKAAIESDLSTNNINAMYTPLCDSVVFNDSNSDTDTCNITVHAYSELTTA